MNLHNVFQGCLRFYAGTRLRMEAGDVRLLLQRHRPGTSRQWLDQGAPVGVLSKKKKKKKGSDREIFSLTK